MCYINAAREYQGRGGQDEFAVRYGEFNGEPIAADPRYGQAPASDHGVRRLARTAALVMIGMPITDGRNQNVSDGSRSHKGKCGPLST